MPIDRSPLLSKKDLEEITGFKQYKKMYEWLDESGIPYRKRIDGAICFDDVH